MTSSINLSLVTRMNNKSVGLYMSMNFSPKSVLALIVETLIRAMQKTILYLTLVKIGGMLEVGHVIFWRGW